MFFHQEKIYGRYISIIIFYHSTFISQSKVGDLSRG